MFRGAAAPGLDPIAVSRRVDFEAPLLAATIGGRPIVLARPDQRRASPDEPVDITVPLTMSRLRRAIDIERDLVAAPYVPSPLFGANMSLSGIVQKYGDYGPNLGWPSPDPALEAQLKAESAGCATKPHLCPMFYEAWQMTARQADKDRLLWAGVAGAAGLVLGALLATAVMKAA